MQRPLRVILPVLALLALASCEGLAFFAPTEDEDHPLPAEACRVARAPLGRLNIQDIDATLASVIGDTSKPARFFPSDVIAPLHFDNDATQLAIAPRLVQDLEGAVGKLVDDAWARDATLLQGSGSPSGLAVQVCVPGGGVSEASCAERILASVARRAWRRPPTGEELSSLTGLYQATVADGDGFAASVKLALRAVLLSPNFLLRTEAVVPNGGAASTWAVASRLSYFLWGTAPDEELLSVAESGTLGDEAVLAAQVARMAGDPRAQAVKERFVSQWFDVRNVEGVSLDAALFPGVTPEVMKGMHRQIDAYLDEFFFRDRDALDFLDAPVTFADGPLARFLGLTTSSEELTRIELQPGHLRAGILGQSAPLVVTSKSTKTNVPKRGNYVLERLLCTPLAPPAGVVVPPVPDATTDQPTVRARLDALTAPDSCNGCHQLLNPPGYALEVFAADSRHRTQENGATIDPTGKFNGTSFANATELVQILKADPRAQRCMVDRTLTYALGRQLTRDSTDEAMITSLLTSFTSSQRRFKTLVADSAKAAASACK